MSRWTNGGPKLLFVIIDQESGRITTYTNYREAKREEGYHKSWGNKVVLLKYKQDK